MVAQPISKAWWIWSSVQAGPAGLASALRRMRARVSLRAAALPLARSCSRPSRSSGVKVTRYLLFMGAVLHRVCWSHHLSEQPPPNYSIQPGQGTSRMESQSSPAKTSGRARLAEDEGGYPAQNPGHPETRHDGRLRDFDSRPGWGTRGRASAWSVGRVPERRGYCWRI